MSEGQAWAVICLLTSLNLQHINLKEKLGELSLKVRKVESFLEIYFKFNKSTGELKK